MSSNQCHQRRFATLTMNSGALRTLRRCAPHQISSSLQLPAPARLGDRESRRKHEAGRLLQQRCGRQACDPAAVRRRIRAAHYTHPSPVRATPDNSKTLHPRTLDLKQCRLLLRPDVRDHFLSELVDAFDWLLNERLAGVKISQWSYRKVQRLQMVCWLHPQRAVKYKDEYSVWSKVQRCITKSGPMKTSFTLCTLGSCTPASNSEKGIMQAVVEKSRC